MHADRGGHRARPSRCCARAAAEAKPLRPGNIEPAAPPERRRCTRTRCTSATRTTWSQDGEVIIVDEFTGRMMPGRRWSRRPAPGGRGQGRRADPGENQTLATITFQNYFRMYKKLAGMTGTADTEADEFQKIYKLDVVVDPDQPADDPQGLPRPRLPDRAREVQRDRRGDQGAATSAGQPVLVGTTSIEKSELLSRPARAGRASRTRCSTPSSTSARRRSSRRRAAEGAVTIATNMAGRGTDIVLGGNVEKQRRSSSRRPTTSCRARGQDRARRDAARRVRSRCTTQVRRSRRPAHHRHRAPRVAPHRQPAARPRRPPGRPGQRRASTCRSKTT